MVEIMRYHSTRNANSSVTFRDAVIQGLAPDGGLYVSDLWPKLDVNAIQTRDYKSIAQYVIAPFTDLPKDDLAEILEKSYTSQKFDDESIAPIIALGKNRFLCELFHGPTLAFKDIALQFLGNLFDYFLTQDNRQMTILGATSGDTGSAAIEACRGRKNIRIFILHPHNRTSDIQRKQMTTVLDDNVFNIAINGTFDDCQNLVKTLFADQDSHYTAINSINWARIIAQSVYYVSSVLRLKDKGISYPNFAVPTGNFGNIYAGFVAKKIGVDIGQLIIGSNRNDILTRTYETGEMRVSNVIPSLSPSMDIQISSNFERYLCDVMEKDTDKLSDAFNVFRSNGLLKLNDVEHQKFCKDFSAYRSSDNDILSTIRKTYDEYGVIVDPHTAVAVHALEQHQTAHPSVVFACAHPAKFSSTIEHALGFKPDTPMALQGLDMKAERFKILPNNADSLRDYIRNA